MAQVLNVEVLTPGKAVANVKATAVNLPGAFGYMTVLAGHAPLVSELEIGELSITKVEGGQKLNYFLSGGYIEVDHDRVIILADNVERPEEIDTGRAEEARKRAEERLMSKSGETDIDRALRAMKRAEGRLQFARGSGLKN